MNSYVSTTDKNILTFTLSALILTAMILGVVFTFEETNSQNSLPSLDVILSKQKNPKAPDKADFLAENDQLGGGLSDENVRPQNIKTGIAVDDQGDFLKEEVENIPELEEVKTLDVIATNHSRLSVNSSKTKPELTKNNPTSQEIKKNQRLAKLENNISDRLEAYAKRPNSKYISASTKSYVFANYMHKWVKKIKRVSNLNYPKEARKRNFIGTLVMTVGIRPDGNIDSIIIVKSSGFRAIDDAAKHLVVLSEPFEPIPKNRKEKIDILYITRTWRFLKGNKLEQTE